MPKAQVAASSLVRIDQETEKHFRFTLTGLEVIGEPTFEQWVEIGKRIKFYNDSIHFIIGDWLNYGEFHWGDTYQKAAKMFKFDIQTLRNDKWITDRVPPKRRKKELSFRHHQVVASMDEEEQERYLQKALAEKLPYRALERLINEDALRYEENAKKLSARADSLASEQANLTTARDICGLIDTLLEKLDSTDISQLSGKRKQKLLRKLKLLEQRCAGVDINHGDE